MTAAVTVRAPELPARSEIVVIGGGVVGCAIAWQLARAGKTDVTVIERRRLTEGTTWHAAGLVGQLRSTASLTGLMQASVQIYAALEQLTGYATGWRAVGSVRVAASAERWAELQRHVQVARTAGLAAELVSARQAQELFPPLNAGGVCGAVWVPSDGYADPSQLTHAFATGARAAGTRFTENCLVQSIEFAESGGRNGQRVGALLTSAGRIECDLVVNATGMWGRQTARLAHRDLPVGAVEHQYVVTEQIAGLPDSLPTLRDPDARIYLKPETGGLLVGGWEDGTRMPWPVPPPDFAAELFAPNHERFAPLGEAATHRIPAFAEAGIRAWVNGPIPFTPDAEPVIGPAPGIDNLFHCCGFPAGIAAAGGAAQAIANWIVRGDPGLDLAPFATGRFAGLAELEPLLVAAYGGYYQLHRPLSAVVPGE
jgi:sarcosine dehydrogenase